MTESVTLSADRVQSIFWGDDDEYYVLDEHDRIIDQNRWTLTVRSIIKRDQDGQCFKIYHDRPATEQQDGMGPEDRFGGAEVELVPTELSTCDHCGHEEWITSEEDSS